MRQKSEGWVADYKIFTSSLLKDGDGLRASNYVTEAAESIKIQVEPFIALGWEPLGGPFVANYQICQAMIRWRKKIGGQVI